MLSDNPRVRANQLARRAKLCVTLEAGTYKQGIGHLRSKPNDRCCCLGVAADIAAPGKWRERSTMISATWNHGLDDKMPGDFVKTYYGFSDNQCTDLARLNDDGMNFDGIAKYIRNMP